MSRKLSFFLVQVQVYMYDCGAAFPHGASQIHFLEKDVSDWYVSLCDFDVPELQDCDLLLQTLWRHFDYPFHTKLVREQLHCLHWRTKMVFQYLLEYRRLYLKRSCLTNSPKIFAACLAHRPSAVLWLTTLGACFVVHGVCLLVFHYFLLLSTETQLPGTGPLESPAAPDVDSDSGASTNIDFIPGTQEEEQPRVLGPPARRRRIQIQDEVLSDEEEEPPLAPGSPPPRGALPAEERLTRERGRLRRVSVLTSVGERLLEHCYEESRRAAAADQAMLTLIAQEGRKLRAVLRETNQILREGVEEVRLIRRLMERAVAVMERAYPPQIAPPPPPTPTPPLPAPTPPTPSQNASTQTRRRTILGKRKIKPADKYSPS
ncbi:uncharacterized protein LOC143823026 [Paroedura picta]|uniref:uncharacterized protein LOC143823026 n=1 Tax=Paroedura picta TaxID=143630 RepID=UPI0040575AEB